MRARIAITATALLGLIQACLLPPSRMSATPGASADEADPSSPHNLLANGTFEGGVSLPWTTSFTTPGNGDARVVDGAFCLDVTNAGTNRWDAQFRHREFVIQRGHTYRVAFRAWADKETSVRPKVGMAGPPYAEYWTDTITLGPEPRTFTAEFSMGEPDDPTAELAFHAGAELAAAVPFRICIDDVALADPSFTRKSAAPALAIPDVLVNQLGYAPGLRKLATLKSAAKTPVEWALLDAQGATVARGETLVHGADAASGDHVHVIDFSQVTQPGDGYRLRAGDRESHPFAIRTDLYRQLRYDALAFFYHQRSGVEIALPYAREKRWARPAGHLGDKSVPCAPGSGCDYALDVSGGWYDAGDHGKYVVNGGISAWTLLNLYERSVQQEAASAFADGALKIPESGNGTPDLLDEARVQVEWLLKMQVPEGKPLSGMAHHKLHGMRWSVLGTAPHEDDMPRYLLPPSTAATLNLAAVAAQSARVYRALDPAFSKRCLAAAERAFAAALAHPKVLAPSQSSEGGGPYGDRDLTDEFYWAAAELLVTTGAPRYREQLQRSPLRSKVPTTLADSADDAGHHTTITWQNVEGAGTISLALGPSSLGEERTRARAELVRAADTLLALRKREGYRLPFAPGPKNSYPWGSNSFLLNNALVLALAHDFTGKREYLDAVVSALDYLLGNNPLDQSYVSGYGARPLRNPHHRFFSRQARPDRPEPPPGFVSGGPNSALQDPYARGAGLVGKPPQKCFLDHIESWSTNEVTINWNAPLAWVVSFLDDHARDAPQKGAP